MPKSNNLGVTLRAMTTGGANVTGKVLCEPELAAARPGIELLGSRLTARRRRVILWALNKTNGITVTHSISIIVRVIGMIGQP